MIVYLTAWSIPVFAAEDANTLMAMYAADFALAWTFGIVFQHFSIVPMREDVGRLQGIWLAIKADTFSTVAFQIGLFGYMALYPLVFWQPPLTVASPRRLVHDADRHDRRLLHLVAGECLAHQAGLEGEDVTGRGACPRNG